MPQLTPPAERTYLPTEGAAVLWPPADAAASYTSIAPPPDLAAHVAALQLGRETIAPGAAVCERVLPDGAVHLVFNLGDAPTVLDAGDAHAASGAGAEAFGPSCGPTVIRIAGRVEAVGVELRAGSALALLGVPAGALAGRTVPLDALWGPLAAETRERVAAAPHGPARVAVVEAVLRERLRRASADGSPASARAAVALIADGGGRRPVRDVAAALGVGERRLEQLFHTHVGLTPKVASRLARFRATVRLLRREPARRWSEIAHRCGYADQAHLVHEYRALTGLTPGDFRARLGFGFPQDAGAVRR